MAAWVRGARASQGLSMRQAAEQLGVGKSRLASIEGGEALLNAEDLPVVFGWDAGKHTAEYVVEMYLKQVDVVRLPVSDNTRDILRGALVKILSTQAVDGSVDKH